MRFIKKFKKNKKILIIILLLILIYQSNPLWLSIARSPIVIPTLLISNCPSNYSPRFNIATGKNNYAFCIKMLPQCDANAIWKAAAKECTPDIIGCAYDEPCQCRFQYGEAWGGSWKKIDNQTWRCDKPDNLKVYTGRDIYKNHYPEK